MPVSPATPVRMRAALLAVTATAVTALACGSSPTSPTPGDPGNPNNPGTPPAPLAVSCPANQSATSFTGGAMAVAFPLPATTGGVAPVRVSCTPDPGSNFSIGSTIVRCTASDAASATAACSFSVAVAAAPRISRTRFLAFGDSITAGEVTAPIGDRGGDRAMPTILVPAASYPTQLSNQMKSRYIGQTAAIDVFNAGLPSEWAEDGALRFMGVMTNQRPEVVLLMEGTNDIAALGSRGVTSAARALETMAKEARLRGARVFIATIPPTRADSKLPIAPSLVAALNDQIRRIAEGETAVLVDVHAAIAANPTLYLGVDGLHPNEAGYRRIAEVFFDAVRAALEVR